jgi:hypothetical protein
MATNSTKIPMATHLILPELSYAIVGACFDAFNEIGGGR